MAKKGPESQAYVLNELAKFGFTTLASFLIPDCFIPIQPPGSLRLQPRELDPSEIKAGNKAFFFSFFSFQELFTANLSTLSGQLNDECFNKVLQ